MIIIPTDITVKSGIIHIYCAGQKEPYQSAYKNYLKISTTKKIEHNLIVKQETVKQLLFGKEVTVVKAYVKNPFDVRQIRDDLPDYDILEWDIPFIRKFLVDNQVTPLQAYDVEIQDRTITSWAPAKKETSFKDFNLIAIDIETYAKEKRINTKINPILSIAIYSHKHEEVLTWTKKESKHKYVTNCKNEKEMLELFNTRMKEISCDFICGYNSDGFDMPYIQDRCDVHKVELSFTKENTGFNFTGGKQPSAHCRGTPHIDIFTFIRTNLRTNLKTTSLSLNAVSKELLDNQKVDVDINDLYDAWDKQDMDRLDVFLEYNLHDTRLTWQLVEHLYANIAEFMRLIPVPVQDITRMAYSQLVENYLINRSREYNVLVPNKAIGDELKERMQQPMNEGAFVFKPTPGLYNNIAVFDFQSLYPSIIASLNIDKGAMTKTGNESDRVPEYDGKLYFTKKPVGFIPQVIGDIIKRRIELKSQIKKEKNAAMKALLAARIYNLKILANSMYGYLSFVHARWYSNECGGATTAYARHYIKLTIEMAKKDGFNVIYGDTDSVFLALGDKTTKDALTFVETLNKTLPGIMELQFEDEFTSGIFVGAKNGTGGAKKRYALRAKSGEFKIAGFEMVRNDWSQLAKRTQREVVEILLNEQNKEKAFAHIKDVIKAVLAGKIDREDLIMHSKLSRDVNEYTSNLPHVVIAKQMIAKGDTLGRGSNIPYLVVKGKGSLFERVKIPSETQDNEIDEEYYINNQVVPVVESIMAVFGYKKEDFTNAAKQNSLDSFF
ncbi:MAG: DNA polymerase elongation subunit (family B) [Candidatus Woesearchaeota archaeon]|jgi:DNA polymerase elongation subunit (family B)